jgi:Zn-dependent protease with chaperone function
MPPVGFLFHILLAVFAMGAAQAGMGLAEVPAWWGLGLLLGPHLCAGLAGRLGQAGRFQTAGLLARLLSVSAPLAFGVLLLATDWLARVRGWTGARLDIDSWPEFALFLAFAPYPLLQAVAVHAEVRHHTPPGSMRRRAFQFQLRMLVSALAPLALYAGVTALVGLVEVVRVQVQEVALVNASFVVLLLASLVFLLPALLTGAWDTVSMPASPQRDVLEAVAARAGFHPRDVRVWRTGNLMANAAIVGMGERRVVLFSDSLLARLQPRELAAVYGHEIGHAKRRHVAVFLVWALAFFMTADWLTTSLAGDSEWLGMGVVLGALVLWALGFGWLSRRCELEADLYSLELLGDPAAMTLALERVGGKLSDVSGWRHFSSRERVAFLWRAWSEPEFARRFRRRLKWLARLGLAWFVLAAGAQLWTLIESYPTDQVRAQLGLGHWTAALEQARDLEEELDPEVLALLELGTAKQGSRPALTAQELEGGLEASLTLGADWQRSAEYASLLALAGRRSLGPVVEVCEALAEGDRERALAALEDCPQRWRDLLRAALASG